MTKQSFRTRVLDHHRSNEDFSRTSWVVRDALVGAGVSPAARELLFELHRWLQHIGSASKMERASGVAFTVSTKELARRIGADRRTVSRYLAELETHEAVEILGRDHRGTDIWIAAEIELLKKLSLHRTVKDHLRSLYDSETGPYSLVDVPTHQELKEAMEGIRRDKAGAANIRYNRGDSALVDERKGTTVTDPDSAAGILAFWNEQLRTYLGASELSKRFNMAHIDKLLKNHSPTTIRNALRILVGGWDRHKPAIGITASKPTPNVVLTFWPKFVAKALDGNEDCLRHVEFDGVEVDLSAPKGHKIPPKRDFAASYREKVRMVSEEEWNAGDPMFRDDGYDHIKVPSKNIERDDPDGISWDD